jgi:predicted permease
MMRPRERVLIVAVVLMLALGIGATTAIFTVVHSVLLEPLPYRDSNRLVRIVHSIGGRDQPYFSDVVYLTYVDNTQTFGDLGVWAPGSTATITGRGEPEEVRALTANRGLLTTLDVAPQLGRWFSADEDAPGAPGSVILLGGYWQRRMGGDPSVLGQSLTINGRPHRIIGVMPAGFSFAGDFEIILPLRLDRAAPVPVFRLLGVARLKPGVTLAQASGDAARILRIWLTSNGQTDPAFLARYQPSLRSLKQHVVGDVSNMLWILMGAIGIVLLMVCANVANLLLVRAEARRHEFEIRAALGATWGRLARQLLFESMALALLGGALGVVVAHLGLRALAAISPSNLPRLAEISIDPTVLAFVLIVSLLSGVLFSLAPVLKHARTEFVLSSLAGVRGASLSRERQRTQQLLVVAQIALALVLLVSSGLMIRSFRQLLGVNPGFAQPAQLQTFTISIPPATLKDPERVTRMQQEILDRIAAIPGVQSAAFTTRLPMGSGRSSAALTAEGQADDGRTPPNRQVKLISPGMFGTFGIPLIAGRDVAWSDVYQGRDIAVVSENLARELWGSPEAALGKRIREYYDRSSPWRDVVGVAGDVHDDGVHQVPPATVYVPAQPAQRLFGLSGYQPRRVTIAIRTALAGNESLLAQLRQAVWSLSNTLPLSDVRTLDVLVGESMARTSFTLVLLGIAGSMALLLGVSGVYGVLSYSVSQRRREIGIRLALGAPLGDIRWLFLQRGLLLGAAGSAIGLVCAAAFAGLMRSLLFGIGPFDPVTFMAMTGLLAAFAALASYLPTRRALRIDPVESMRD